jgi:hypothetical protein
VLSAMGIHHKHTHTQRERDACPGNNGGIGIPTIIGLGSGFRL